MVLFSGHLGALFARSIKITNCYGALPFQWNNTNLKLTVIPDAPFKTVKYRFIISLLIFPMFLAQASTGWANFNQSVKMYTLFTISTYFMGLSCGYANIANSDSICTLMNSMVKFEKIWRKGTLSKPNLQNLYTEKAEKRVAHLITLVSYLVFAPIFYHSQLLVYPCLPTFVGYQLLEECSLSDTASQSSHLTDQMALKITLFTFGVVHWTFVIESVTLHLWLLFFFGYGFKVYIEEFCRFLQNIQQFNSKIRSDILSFRQIQLIISFYREIAAKSVLLSVVAVGALVNISELYNVCAILSSNGSNIQDVPWQMTLACIWGFVVSTVVTLSAFTYLGNVYKASICGFKVLRKTKRDRLLRAFIVSCPVQKIHFGSFSFFEPITSLNIEAFVLDHTVSLLLLA